jgi:glycosyltransferase involved in cell wall biosynthesis
MTPNGVAPQFSIVIPTFNNVAVLTQCLDAWQTYASGEPIEIIVIEDGCRDDTPQSLEHAAATPWGRRHLRWVHENNVHELQATNRGFQEARAPIVMAWQDDMFVRAPWFVSEILATFDAYPDLGLLSLSRGLKCVPCRDAIESWDDLIDWRRLQSTIGDGIFNWCRLQEVDIVIRPWAVRLACLERVGHLDPAFVPTEWDEADLCYRIRQAGWKIATHGYERLGAYDHLGSTTISRAFTEAYKQRVLRNGLLFHERWDATIEEQAARPRRTWWRRTTAAAWAWTAAQAARALIRSVQPAPKSTSFERPA